MILPPLPANPETIERNIKRHSEHPDRLALKNDKHPYAEIDSFLKEYLEQFSWSFIPSQHKKYKLGKHCPLYAVHCAYVSREGKSKTQQFFLHRVIWEYINGPIPKGLEIDHIDRNGLNNKLSNLRCVTKRENLNNTQTKKPKHEILEVTAEFCKIKVFMSRTKYQICTFLPEVAQKLDNVDLTISAQGTLLIRGPKGRIPTIDFLLPPLSNPDQKYTKKLVDLYSYLLEDYHIGSIDPVERHREFMRVYGVVNKEAIKARNQKRWLERTPERKAEDLQRNRDWRKKRRESKRSLNDTNTNDK